MNKSSQKQQHTKKQPKLTQSNRPVKPKTQPLNKHSRSKSKQFKPAAKQLHSILKSPQSKHEQYFKLSAYHEFPSKQSSSLKPNLSNDYCVNEYFVKSTKLKTDKQKSEYKSFYPQDYFNPQHDFKTVESQIEPYTQEYGFDLPAEKLVDETHHTNNKISHMMKKISFSDKRALINCDGKIVSSSKEKTKKSQLNHSNSQNTLSFSKQYLSKNDTHQKSKSKQKLKSKSKQHKLKQSQKQKSREQKDKDASREHRQPSEKMLKVKSGQKRPKKQHIVIKKSHQPLNKAANISQSKHLGEQKHSYTKSSQTLTSKQHPAEPFYYYQRHPTSTTTLVDHSSTESCSSSMSSFKPETRTHVDFGEIAAQIAAEVNVNSMTLRKEKELKYNGHFHTERLKCINLIADVCGELRTNRETFAMAAFYFDRYVLNFDSPNIKCIALTCIMIALKMDIPELLPKYCFAFRPNPEATIKKSSKTHKKKKSEQGSGSSSLIKQKDSFMDTKDRLSILMTLPIYSTKDSYGHEKQEDFHIGEIIEAEIDVMTKLKFRFYFKTCAYWVDLMTSAWDDYVAGTEGGDKLQKPEQSDNMKVFFKRSVQDLSIKSHKDFKLFSYLNQTVDSALTQSESYKYNPITLTLSSMYLLIRLHLQERKSLQPLAIYKLYRDNLAKSCNLIFCDSVGANELFGNFLSKLNLNMALIVQAVQFVSRFIVPEDFKIWNYREMFGDTYADRLSNFNYNPNLFRTKNI